MKKNIAILADSSAGLTKNDFTTMQNLFLCPLLISFDDGVTIEDNPLKCQNEKIQDQNFVERLTTEKQVAKTAQSPLGLMMKTWEKLLESYEKIIFIPLSKGLSGQYNTACMLAKEPKFKDKVFVFDSNGVTIINWLLVRKACRLSTEKDITVKRIFEALTPIANNFTAFILPRDINYLARGGRISKTAASLANLLKIQPILSFDGTIDKFGTTKTFKRALNKILNEFEKIQKTKKIKLNVCLIHAHSDEQTVNAIKKMIESCGFEIYITTCLANVITAHTGIGTIAIVGFSLLVEELS